MARFTSLPHRAWLALLALALLGACRGGPAAPTATPTAGAVEPTAPAATTTPEASPTPPPTAEETARAYLAAWQAGDYAAMHGLLAPESHAALPLPDFEAAYRRNLSIMSAAAYTPTFTSLTETGETADAAAHLTYATHLVGTLEADVRLPLQRAQGRWGVVFDPASIWPDLVNGNQLFMLPFVPDRGTIYDRYGQPMVAMADAYAIGMVPGEVVDTEAVAVGLGRLLGRPASQIAALFEFAAPDLYLPLGEVSADQFARLGGVTNQAGVRATPYTARFYFGQGAAAHITGYTVFFQPDELLEAQAAGYSVDQRLGQTGVEGWGESLLAGRNGGQLTLLDSTGQQVLKAIAIGDPAPAQDITTTIDFDLQQDVSWALGDFTAAAVVLRVDTGEVLALASNPTFDPNLFDPANLNTQFADPGAASTGLLNRATQDAFPAGSIFKIVTFSAGLTSGLFTPETTYTCDGTWEELGPDFVRYDWTVEAEVRPHGTISLVQGLSGSCNPWFWHIGKALNDFNPQWLPDTARAFGLGASTGLEVLEETPGRIPDPDYKQQTQGTTWEVVDTLNLAIGQGDMLATPLQIARLAAAVGNAGTLMRPQLISQIGVPGQAPSFTFRSSVAGQLPLSEAQLAALQAGMYGVTQEPLGTARNRFRGLGVRVAGKTGTAETGVPEPHAWFAGYTFAGRPNLPDIAVAVWVSNRGQGSDIAAPIFRRIIESYFGLGFTRYPWEESVGVVATPEPTPDPNATPTEEATPGAP